MSASLRWIIEIIGADKLDSTAQKIKALESATATKNISPLPMASGASAPGSVVIGGVALNANQLDAVNRAAAQLGTSLQRMAQSNPRLLQGILSGLRGGGLTPINATIEEIKAAAFAAPPIAAAAAGAASSSLSKSMASLFQRMGARGLGLSPFAAGPLASVGSGLSGASVLTVSAAMAGLAAIIGTTVLTLREFLRAVRDGTSLYDRAAKSGISVDKLAQAERMGRAGGIAPESIDRLLASGFLGRGSAINFQNMLLAARRLGDTGLLQQLINEKSMIGWQAGQPRFAGVAGISARFKELSVISGDIGERWRVVWSRLSDSAASAINLRGILLGIDSLAGKLSNIKVPSWFSRLMMFERVFFLGGGAVDFGNGPHASADNKRFPMSPYIPTPNRWERLGFATGPGMDAHAAAVETAHNTREMAKSLKEQKSALSIVGHALSSSLSAWLHHPSSNHP